MSISERNGSTAAGTGASGDQDKYLSITMGGEIYGIELLRIKEIIQYGSVTPLPMMPVCVRGAINLRGRGVPVVDLALRFGRDDSDPSRRNCIVIVEAQPEGAEHFDVGLLVDAVNQVVAIDADAVEPAPSAAACAPISCAAWARWTASSWCCCHSIGSSPWTTSSRSRRLPTERPDAASPAGRPPARGRAGDRGKSIGWLFDTAPAVSRHLFLWFPCVVSPCPARRV